MKREKIFWVAIYCLCWLVAWPSVVRAQGDGHLGGGVDLQIRLRSSDGSAITGEPVVLQRLPEEENIAPDCITDTGGMCTWQVRRGLYQVLFNRPLDAVSALAVAEGGLRGLGITVGDGSIADGAITYHFTFHSDDRVYFDAAPEAAIPLPIIPEPNELHGGVPATPVPLAVTADPANLSPTPEPTATPIGHGSASTPSPWRFLIFIGLGLVVGGGLHFLRLRSGQAWTRKRKQPDQTATKETEDA